MTSNIWHLAESPGYLEIFFMFSDILAFDETVFHCVKKLNHVQEGKLVISI